MASQLLYGGNTFFFGINGHHQSSQCLSNLLNDKEHTIYWPDSHKPFHRWYSLDNNDNYLHADPERPRRIQERILEQVQKVKNSESRLVNDQAPVPDIEGWVYYDQLFHFLWTIGAKSAGMIKSITLHGSLNQHRTCEHTTCHSKCTDDIAKCIELYIPFLKECTPNLESLNINAWDNEQLYNKWDEDGNRVKGDLPSADCMENAFKPLLEEKLRVLPKLKNLDFSAMVIIDDGEDRQKWTSGDFGWVEAACAWFSQRGAQHRSQAEKRRVAEREAQLTARLAQVCIRDW